MIHKYSQNGFNIVIDVGSGSVHVVDEAVFDVLDFYPEKDENETVLALRDKFDEATIRSCLSEIRQLRQDGLLFTDDDYTHVLPVLENHKPVVKALCLHIAHDCNLKCEYCFAEEGEYHGKREWMSFHTGKAAIDFLIMHSGNRRNLEIDFFGGEPLMNFEVVKQIVDYARSLEEAHNKRFRFTITTNGILLDEEKTAYINTHMQNVVLSLDGRPEVNDKMRKRAGGQGSYHTIVPKYQYLVDQRDHKNYYVRGTFTRHNMDFAQDVLHLVDLGFKQVSVEPVVTEPDADFALRPDDIDRICAEYDRLALELLKRKQEGRDIHFFHFFIDLEGGPCVAKRIVGCGAGTEYLAVVPGGDLYPCHQFAGIPSYKMGHVETGLLNPEKRREFAGCHVYAKEECKACWAKYYCSGGCAANAYQQNGDILKPYELGCILQRKRCECAIMLQCATNP